MTDPLDKLLARTGKTREEIPHRSRLGHVFHKGGVRATEELRRILSLPSYRWQDDPDIPALCEWITQTYGLGVRFGCKPRCGHYPPLDEGCSECDRARRACVCRGMGIMVPRPVQAAALQAIHDHRGLLANIRVGGGKTLIHYLAGVILGAERALLIIPAKLRKKTQRDFALLRKHWVSPRRMHIISYELLSRDRGLAELHAFKPDLIATDESHKFQNSKSACWVRLERYLKEYPTTVYVDMSGTMTKRSLMDYHHRAMKALPDGMQPLPRTKNECREWSGALDVDPKVTPMKPGALIRLCNEEEIQKISLDPSYNNTQTVVRSAYARRLLTAPGVVGTEESFDGEMSLSITGHEFPLGERVIEAFKTLRDTWALPDGHPIDSPTELWRHARELAQGMFYKWTPDPPREWLLIRKVWSAALRQIRRDCHEFESDLMVVRAIDSGRLSWAKDALENWRAIKDIYKPNTVAKWIDDSCLRWVEDWASRGDPGVIWCWETHFARELAKRTGLSYYGSKGLCDGKMIEDETKTCIASIKANYEGRNLQDSFARNLIVSTPPGADVWEQIMGRTHRDGQRKDEVTFDVLLLCYEQWNVFRQARRRAEYVERTMRQCQKLNFADIDITPEAEIMARHASGDPLWCKTNADFFEGGGKYTLDELGIKT
jgi:hypothetical protein